MFIQVRPLTRRHLMLGSHKGVHTGSGDGRDQNLLRAWQTPNTAPGSLRGMLICCQIERQPRTPPCSSALVNHRCSLRNDTPYGSGAAEQIARRLQNIIGIGRALSFVSVSNCGGALAGAFLSAGSPHRAYPTLSFVGLCAEPAALRNVPARRAALTIEQTVCGTRRVLTETAL